MKQALLVLASMLLVAKAVPASAQNVFDDHVRVEPADGLLR